MIGTSGDWIRIVYWRTSNQSKGHHLSGQGEKDHKYKKVVKPNESFEGPFVSCPSVWLSLTSCLCYIDST